MALYKDGNPLSGLNSIPRLTLAQYNALNVKPEFWVRTDAPESYKKLSADQVSYDSSNTVKDKIDDIESLNFTKTSVGVTDGQYGFFSVNFTIGTQNYYDVPILGIHIQGDANVGNRDVYIGQVISGGLAGRFLAISPVGVVMISPS